MKLARPCCPDCGKPAIGTIEHVVAMSSFDDDPSKGDVKYDGNTDFSYSPDEQKTVTQRGRSLVVCEDHHRWWTVISEKK